MTENQDQEKGLVEAQQSQVVPAESAQVKFETVSIASAEEAQAAAVAIDKAQVMPWDVKEKTWGPEAEGEQKRLMFMGGEIRWMPPFEDKSGELQPVPVVIFVEPVVAKDGSGMLQQVVDYSSDVVHHFLHLNDKRDTVTGYRFEQRTLWMLTYTGRQKSKTGKLMRRFRVQPLQIQRPNQD